MAHYTRTRKIDRPYCPDCGSHCIRLVEDIKRFSWVYFETNSSKPKREDFGEVVDIISSKYKCMACDGIYKYSDLDINTKKE